MVANGQVEGAGPGPGQRRWTGPRMSRPADRSSLQHPWPVTTMMYDTFSHYPLSQYDRLNHRYDKKLIILMNRCKKSLL